eukprot:tig00020876_g14845.t1
MADGAAPAGPAGGAGAKRGRHAALASRNRSVTGLGSQLVLSDRASATSGGDGEGSNRFTGSTTSSGNTSALFGLGEVARLFQETVFGVVAVMSRGSQRRLAWAVLEAAIVGLQFLLFPMQLFSWAGLGTIANPVREVLRLAVPFRLSSLRYEIYLGIFWTASALVGLCLATAAYVGYAFARQDFRFMFPLRFLHFAVSRCISLLYMPLISVFSAAWNCPLRSSGRPTAHNYFPENLICWTGPHIPLMLVSLAAALLFTAFAFAAALLFFEPDATKAGPEGEREYFSRPHSRVDALFLLNNVALSVLVNIDSVPPILLGLLFLGSGLAFLYATLSYYPYHRLPANMHQAGVFGAFSYMSLLCVLDAHYGERLPGLSYAFLGGTVPAYLAGLAFAWARFRLQMCTGRIDIVRRIKSPLHVEIAARFVFDSAAGAGAEADFDEAAVDAANQIFRAGVEKFPGSASVLLAYATFCFGVLRSPELAHEKVQQAAKLHPALDSRYIIYQYELERQQKAHAIDLGDAKRDLIAHIEYTSNLQGARKYHRAGVRALRKFWGQLAGDPHDLNLQQLESTLARIDLAERRAHAHYRALLVRYPRAPRILRAYGRFQADVLNDEGEANALFEQADMYEEARGQDEGGEAASRGSSAYGPSRGASVRFGAGPGPRQGSWREQPAPTLKGLAASLLSGLTSSLRSRAAKSSTRVQNDPEHASGAEEAVGNPWESLVSPRPDSEAEAGAAAGAAGLAALAPGEEALAASAAALGGEGARRLVKKTSFLIDRDDGPRPRSRLPELSPEALAQTQSSARSHSGSGASSPVPPARAAAHEAAPQKPSIRRRRRSASLDDAADAPPAPPPRRRRLPRRAAGNAVRGDLARPRPRAAERPLPPLRVPTRLKVCPLVPDGPEAAGGASGESGPPSALPSPPASFSLRGGPLGASLASLLRPAGDGAAPGGASVLLLDLQGPDGRGEGKAAPAVFSMTSFLNGPTLLNGEGGPRASAASSPAAAAGRGGGGPAGASAAGGGGGGAASEGEASGTEDEAAARRRKLRRWTRVKRRVQSAGQAHASSIRRMKHVVLAVLAAVAILAAVAFAVIDHLVSQYEDAIVQVAESGKRRKDAALSAFHAQGLMLAGGAWDGDGRLEARSRAGLEEAAAELDRFHVLLYKLGARVPEDTEASIRVRAVVSDLGDTGEVPTTLWAAGLELVSNAQRVAGMPLAALRSPERPQARARPRPLPSLRPPPRSALGIL